jgi:sec-independent protein translocase protein TatC
VSPRPFPALAVPRRRRRDPDGRMPVMDHLRELRRRVIACVLIIAVGTLISWFFYNPILHFIERPYCSVPSKFRNVDGTERCVLTNLGPADGFIARLKVCAVVGAAGSAPFWLYQIWAFLAPGLRQGERKYTLIFVGIGSFLFTGGMAVAYGVLFAGLRVLIEQAGNNSITQLTTDRYLSFLIMLMLVFGVAFELPLLVVMLNLVRVLPYRVLRKWQRLSIFLIFVFAGVATPTADPFTMLAMALPMLLLFELAVLYTFIHDRRRERRQAEATAAEPQLSDDEASVIDPIPSRIDSGGSSAGNDFGDTT